MQIWSLQTSFVNKISDYLFYKPLLFKVIECCIVLKVESFEKEPVGCNESKLSQWEREVRQPVHYQTKVLP